MRAVVIGAAAAVIVIGVSLATRRGAPTADSVSSIDSLIDDGAYVEAEAAARAELDRVVAGHLIDSPEDAVVADRVVRALRANGRAAADQTLALAEQSVRRWRTSAPPRQDRLAAALVGLGQVLSDRGDHVRAIATLVEALATSERVYRADSPEAAVFLTALGQAYAEARAYDLARPLLERSLRIGDATGDAGRATTAHSLEALVTVSQRKGNYAEGRKFLTRLIDLQAATPPAHPERIPALNLQALQLWFEGRLAESKAASLEALALTGQTLRVDHPWTANTVRILAATLWGLGELAESRTQSIRALEIAQRSLGAGHPEVAAFWNDLGNVNLELGAYTQSRRQFAEALRLAQSQLGPDHEWIPNFTHNLALVDAALGDLDAARQEQSRATALWERLLGPEHPFVAVGLGELADVMRRQGASADAVPLLRRALAIRERSQGPNHRETAQTLAELASSLAQLGQQGEARQLADRALRILQPSEAPDSPTLASVLELHARLELAGGSAATAKPYFERALAVRSRALGASHPLVADTMVGLATAEAALGRARDATRIAVEAENIGREHLKLMLRHLPERQSLTYAAARPRGLDLILSLASGRGTAAIALDALVRSRALVLDEMAVRHRVAPAEAGVDALHTALADAHQRLANVLVRGPRESAPAHYRALVEAARRAKDEAEQALIERSATYRAALREQRSGLREIRAAIPANAALVSYVRFSQQSGASSRAGSAYLAFVTRRDRGPVAIPLGNAEELERRITRWRAAVRSHTTTGAARVRQTGVDVRQALWDPLTSTLAGASTVFVVPDGALSLVPLAALPGYTHEYLVEETHNIHYLSAERDLAALHAPATQTGLLALGGAAFDAPVAAVLHAGGAGQPSRSIAACEAFENLQFTPLAGTLAEVTEIVRVWQAALPGPLGSSRLLVARDADETTFKREAPQHRVLHLATHGFFLNGVCGIQPARTRSVGGLALADADGSRRTGSLSPEGPLQLAGLALAGANRRATAAATDDDGILTAEEVAALDLRNVEWAVLSACDSGVGEVRAGEGVLGLRRSFAVAGVHTVIMSLWPVEDEATRQWMVALYRARFSQHRSTSVAMRDASLSVLRARRAAGESTAPFHWAAFVAVGDWR